MADAVQLAKSVLAADGQPFATLSLAQGLPPVTADSAVADARRNYMRLAGAIHPDRLQATFDKATEAFQCLVRAFECFADPKSRKKAAADALKKAKERKGATATTTIAGAAAVATKVTKTSSKKQPKATERTKAEKAPKKRVRTSTAAAKQKKKSASCASDDEEEEELSEQESEEEDDEGQESEAAEDAWEEWAAADTEPEVSTSRTPIGQPRVGELYQQSTVGCPKCRSQWEPDSRPQYSLFMGHWGKKVHCQLCLFEFGCATALHNCPHCNAPFDYDVSMYDEVQTCQKCKKQFGFPYYPVNQHLIDQIALEEWRERKERAKAAEREARARARHDSGDAEQTQLWIGTCIMEEECPLCHQRVKSKHRSHVLECLAKSPEERAAVKTTKGRVKAATHAAALQKPAAKKAETAVVASKKLSPKANPVKKAAPRTTAKKAPPKKVAPRKRRRGGGSSSDDDDTDSEASLSESEDDDVSSESSFSDDDDDDDSD
jgi:curved DNA-binding protein CbpA